MISKINNPAASCGVCWFLVEGNCVRKDTKQSFEVLNLKGINYYDGPIELMPALAMILGKGGYTKPERCEVFRNHEIDYADRRLCEEMNAKAPRTLDKFRHPITYDVL